MLSGAGSSALAVKAVAWSVGAQRFLIQCTEAGNVEACYILGMIRFYYLFDLRGGAALLNKAAMSSHAAALYSLAVIRFNGSEGSRQDKDGTAGAHQLCARAASLGHVDAARRTFRRKTPIIGGKCKRGSGYSSYQSLRFCKNRSSISSDTNLKRAGE